jgi:anti-anti-sigma factor
MTDLLDDRTSGILGSLPWVDPDEGLLTIRAYDAGGVRVVALSGEVDLTNHRVLRAALTRALAQATGPVVVDLTDLTFCDVRGVAAVLLAGAAAARRGTGFALCGMTPVLARVYQIAFTGPPWTDRPAARYPTTTDALAALTTR